MQRRPPDGRLAPLCHVAFGAAQVGQGRNPVAQAGAMAEGGFVGGACIGLAGGNDGVERRLAKGRADDVQQLDGQRGVGIGKAGLGGCGEAPALGGTPDPARRAGGDDKTVLGEAHQLLTRGFT
ncbi:MAG: hypothetical protein B7Z15_23790 [Rhizobiales bacterium 32-66-8]|nr:MAG: hypothetical protein B7Z15_23790 [Rhizobiales bacterium 32-66-8]